MIETDIEPVAIELSTGHVVKPGRYVFFCHASYEPRAEASTRLDFDGAVLTSVVIVSSKEYHGVSAYSDRLARMIKYWQGRSDVSPIAVDRSGIVQFVRDVDKMSGRLGSVDGIIVDITTFPRDRMICLIDYCLKVQPELDVYLIYAEPAAYGDRLTYDKEGWLSKGVKDILPVPGFNGRQSVRKRSMLVVFVGYESERLHITIRNLEPDAIVLVGQDEGQQHIAGAGEKANRLCETVALEYKDKVIKTLDVGSREYLRARDVVFSIASEYGAEYNLSVAVFGTKLQILGVMLACRSNKNNQIIYTHPQVYNVDDYSRGVGGMWAMKVRSK